MDKVWQTGQPPAIPSIGGHLGADALHRLRPAWRPAKRLNRRARIRCRRRARGRRLTRPPSRGELSRRSTTLANASGDESAANASISSGVAGRPVRSKVARRSSVRRSAAGAGCPPCASSFARMKRSMELPDHPICHGGFFATNRCGCCLSKSQRHRWDFPSRTR